MGETAILGIFGGIGLFGLVMALVMAGFWFWMFIDVLVKQNEDKIVWLLVVFFLSFVGSLVYYFVARKKRLTAATA